MRKFLFPAVASLLFMGAAHAGQVAECQGGFAIKVIGGNKASCVKTQNVEDDVGPRKCAADGKRTSTEASNGGDLCQGTATALNSLLVGPALDCKLSYGLDARNKEVSGGRDRCVKTVRREVTGDITVR